MRLSRLLASPSSDAVRGSFDKLSIRTALFLGFVLIFAIWLLSAYDLVRRIRIIETRAQDMNQRFTQSEEMLSDLRGDILLSGIRLRDAVLALDDEAFQSYRQQLRETKESIDNIVRNYSPLSDSAAEQESWSTLRSELNDYWQLGLPVLEWDATRRASEARAFLKQRVMPKRDQTIRISDDVRSLNRQYLKQKQAEIERIYSGMKWRVWATSVLAVLLGLLIAVLVTGYAARLERRIQEQHVRDQENQAKLQRLSARLVGAQEDERRHIARELHDEIGQLLSAIKMDVTSAAQASDPAARERLLEEARSIADRTIHFVRDLSHLLHPSILDDLGLPDALKWYLQEFSRRTRLRTDLIQSGVTGRMSSEVETCAYRMVQEALTNVTKHAQASACRVYLQRLPNSLLVTVEDDGKGFDPSKRESKDGHHPGLGLIGIQERSASLGGSYRLESRPGKGTRVSVELPVADIPETVAIEGEA